MFKTIKIEFNDFVTKDVTIDMTQDTSLVMDTMVDLFKDAIGDKFGENQAQELRDNKTKDVGKLLDCNLQSGYTSFHRVNFDDGSQIMPKIRIDKDS